MINPPRKDVIFSHPETALNDFRFDEQVAEVFEDMINRSVPGYHEVITMSGLFAERFVQPNSNCYDLGCSLGATTLAMRQRINSPGAKIIAVDNSEAMIKRCRQNIAADCSEVPVEIYQSSIQQIDFSNCSMAVINYTLQFLAVEERQALLEHIYQAMLPNAVLILSEKILLPDSDSNELFTSIYHAWKAHNGYSEMEIQHKRDALENVLIPETIATHFERLHRVGFRQCEIWFRCFNFISMVAFKSPDC